MFSAREAPDCQAEQDVQLFCHFNVYLHHNDRDSALLSSEEETSRHLQLHVTEQLPYGWRGQVLFVRIMEGTTGWIAVHKICFFGERRPIRQAEADRYRTFVQDSMVSDKIPLLLRRHWAISNPYPSNILSSIVDADKAR